LMLHQAEDETTSKMMWFRSPPSVYFGWGGTQEALRDLEDAKIRKVFIMLDRNVHSLGYHKILTEKLDTLEIDYETFPDVSSPTSAVVSMVIESMRHYRPDCVMALGGGSVMDVAKICRIIYDPSNPHTQLKDLYAFDHMQLLLERDQKTGVAHLPPCDAHIKKLVCIPTTSGTGSEMTPIAWVTDELATNKYAIKRPIVSWRMTPDIAINDGYFTADLPKDEVANGGLNAFVCAIESAVSRLSNDYTSALSLRSAKLIYDNLVESSTKGDQTSRANCHNAASIAGMAAANAFVGVAHALSFVIQRFFEMRTAGGKVTQGVASMLVLPQVIKFNASKSEKASKQYAHMADNLRVSDSSDSSINETAKVDALVQAVEKFKRSLGVPLSIKDAGVSEEEFTSHIDDMAEATLKVVGCAATNPVEVSVAQAKLLLEKAFEGTTEGL